MSTYFSEETNVIPDDESVIVPCAAIQPMRRSENPLQDYVLRVMKENKLSYPDVERMARRRGGNIGKSTIQQIAKGETPNPGIQTLVELAWGLGKPPEELVSSALGAPSVENPAFKRSDFANLADLYQQLPNGEQRALRRVLQMVEREMRRVLMQLSELPAGER